MTRDEIALRAEHLRAMLAVHGSDVVARPRDHVSELADFDRALLDTADRFDYDLAWSTIDAGRWLRAVEFAGLVRALGYLRSDEPFGDTLDRLSKDECFELVSASLRCGWFWRPPVAEENG